MYFLSASCLSPLLYLSTILTQHYFLAKLMPLLRVEPRQNKTKQNKTTNRNFTHIILSIYRLMGSYTSEIAVVNYFFQSYDQLNPSCLTSPVLFFTIQYKRLPTHLFFSCTVICIMFWDSFFFFCNQI